MLQLQKSYRRIKMKINHLNEQWVFYKDIQGDSPSPGVVRKVLAYCDTLMCVEHYFDAGAEGALHSHPHTQITYVAAGRFSFTIGDEVREISKGDTLCKQDGIKHGCVCLEKGILLDFFNPMREEFAK